MAFTSMYKTNRKTSRWFQHGSKHYQSHNQDLQISETKKSVEYMIQEIMYNKNIVVYIEKPTATVNK